MSPKEDRLRWAQAIKESAPGARMHELLSRRFAPSQVVSYVK